MNLYHVTKFSPLKLSLIVYYFYTKITSFTQALSKEIVLSSFYLLIFYFDRFSTWIWRLPFALCPKLWTGLEGRNHEQWLKSETAHVKSLSPRVNDQWYLTKFTLIILPNSCGKLLICCWCFQVGGGWICRVSILWESSVEHVHFAHDSGS